MGNSRDKKLYEKTKHTITGWFNIHYKRLQQRQRKKFGIDLPFDRWELEQWILKYNFDIFIKLFKNWQNNDYNSDLVPSIDRIDCMKSYSFDNIQLLTWKENSEKYNEIERKKYNLDKCEHMVSKTRKKVQQFDFDGNFIKDFISISEASRQVHISFSCICECCQGKRKTAKGYRWKYE